ncbi:MAG: hypothetical protein V4611_04075 [Patescibacteria group bacterium]
MTMSVGLKRSIGILMLVATPFAAALFGIGGDSASAAIVNYSEAVATINGQCAAGETMAHAVYGSSPSLNESTGVVTYNVNILWQRCNWNGVEEYAITGYDGNACPVVGMYHAGYTPTQDCIKYSNRHDTMGNCGAPNCVYKSTWDAFGTYQGADWGPGDTALHSKTITGRTVTIADWSTKTRNSGSEEVFISRMCSYYSGDGNRLCQNAVVKVSWDRPWTITGKSYIQNGATARKSLAVEGTINAEPGDRLNWYHDMRNNGPSMMGENIYFNVDKTGFSNGWNDIKDPTGTTGDGVGSGVLFVYEYAKFPGDPTRAASPYTLYDVTQSDVGNTVCQRIAWNPGSSSSDAWAASTEACAYVPYNYSLNPVMDSLPSETVEPSTDYDVTGVISNPSSSVTKSHTPIRWRITQIIFDKSVTPNLASYNGGTPCATPRTTTSTDCDVVGTGDTGTNAILPGGLNNEPLADVSTGDWAVGTKVCYSLSISPYSSASGSDWRHSDLVCQTVSKKPKVQILGGDLIVGRETAYNDAKESNVVTGSSFSSGTSKYYGSWSEYAIIASGTVRGMASAALYSEGADNSDLCNLSLLTIGNRKTASGPCQPTNIGKYVTGSTAPNIATRFPVSDNISGASVDIKDLATKKIYSISGATLNISSTVPIGDDGLGKGEGKWVAFNDPEATVTITSDINYTPGPLGDIDDIPQVIIIAKNILIADSVRNIDAWLIAVGKDDEGYINTCSSVTAGSPVDETLNDSKCGIPLTVNGPVLANKLYLYRTAGAGVRADTGDPAEVFNLRADSYIWSSSYSAGNGRVPTVSAKELPPRY